MSQAEINRALWRGQRREGPEAPIVRAVLDYLNLQPQCKAWRQNVGGMRYRKATGQLGLVKFGQAGMADITGIIHGLRLEVEVKAPGKEPSALQYAWLRWIRDLGGIALWCDSIETCGDRLKEAFSRKREV